MVSTLNLKLLIGSQRYMCEFTVRHLRHMSDTVELKFRIEVPFFYNLQLLVQLIFHLNLLQFFIYKPLCNKLKMASINKQNKQTCLDLWSEIKCFNSHSQTLSVLTNKRKRENFKRPKFERSCFLLIHTVCTFRGKRRRFKACQYVIRHRIFTNLVFARFLYNILSTVTPWT